MNSENFLSRQNEVLPIDGLTNLPVQAKCQWVAKINPPAIIPRTKFSLHCELASDMLMLVTLIICSNQGLRYQRFWRSAACNVATISLSFFPYDWDGSDEVQVSLFQQATYQTGGIQAAVHSETLKQDPRQLLTVPLLGGNSCMAGSIVDLAIINFPSPLYARLLVVLKSDTEACHSRWRLKQSLPVNLPSHLSFLRQGYCSGSVSFKR